MAYIFAATAAAPFGFMPVETPSAPAVTNLYRVSTANGPITIGDVVVCNTGGLLNVAASGSISVAGTGVETVIGVAAETLASGVAVNTFCLVYDDPDQVFVVRDNGNATAGIGATGVGSIGRSFTFNATATATSTAANRSQMHLLGTSGSTNQVNPFKLLGMHPVEGYSTGVLPTASGVFRLWRVKFTPAAHLLSGGSV